MKSLLIFALPFYLSYVFGICTLDILIAFLVIALIIFTFNGSLAGIL